MKNFFKKPFNIVSLALAVLGLVGMIVILCVPHGGTYKKTEEVDGKKVTAYVMLKGDEVYMNSKIDGELQFKEDQKIASDVEYKGGKAYYANIEVFEANAFRITLDGETMTCAASIAFFIIAGVMFLAGAAGTVFAVVRKKK